MNALFRDPQPVEVFGAQAADKYEIDDNPSIYTLLSDVVYSKPNLAVVREYLTNGWDSHKEAGTTDLPMEVHITENPPRILFKDFGTGLDHHGMTTVFRYFFRTTKDTNDDATGCLGIGSKVAFAATEAFTAIGVKDGRRHVFANAKDADGRPIVNTMTPVPGGVPTDEPNGVTIDIPLPDAKIIPDLVEYVQDLRAASTMKIRLFRAGREVDAPVPCFGEALREHGFAYVTARMSDAWGVPAPCIVQGEIPYSGQPFGGNAAIPLPNLYIHAPSRAFQFTLSREQLRLTARGQADYTQRLASIEAAIREAYFDLLCDVTARAPIFVMIALSQKSARTEFFRKTLGDRRVFAGALEAARYIAAAGADEELFAAIEHKLIARYLNRPFADLRSAKAALRKRALKAAGHVAAAISPTAAAPQPFTRYAVKSRGTYPPASSASKSYVYLDGLMERHDRRAYAPTPLLPSTATARTRQLLRVHTAEEILLAAASGNITIIVRRAAVKTMHLRGSKTALPGQFYVIEVPPKADQPLAAFVPTDLNRLLQKYAGRSGLFFDDLPQLGQREPVQRAARLPAPTPPKPKTAQIINLVDWDHGGRVSAEKIRLYVAAAPHALPPLFFINVTPYRLKDGYYRIPRSSAHYAFLKGLASHARHRIAVATRNEQAAELEAQGLHRIAIPGRDPDRIVTDPIALRLAAWLTNVDRIKDTQLGARSDWEAAMKHVFYGDFAELWGKTIQAAVQDHAAQFASASFALGSANARAHAREEWETFAQKRPLLTMPKHPSRMECIKMLRQLAPDLDPSDFKDLFRK